MLPSDKLAFWFVAALLSAMSLLTAGGFVEYLIRHRRVHGALTVFAVLGAYIGVYVIPIIVDHLRAMPEIRSLHTRNDVRRGYRYFVARASDNYGWDTPYTTRLRLDRPGRTVSCRVWTVRVVILGRYSQGPRDESNNAFLQAVLKIVVL